MTVILPEFQKFKSIPRLIRPIVVTEKIDGTNGCVYVDEEGGVHPASRNQWLNPDKPDNYDFGAWVRQHASELKDLGPGWHYGEWWGIGVARRYNISERRWSLFNVSKWGKDRPECCHVVPTLGRFETGISFVDDLENCADQLLEGGSVAAPGYMYPEGIVIFHEAAQQYFKFTFDGDGHKTGGKR